MSRTHSVLPPTVTRVERATADEINARIAAQTEAQVVRAASIGRPAILRRLDELEHEWDIERTLEANASSISLLGLGLGLTVHRRWFALPLVVATFLLVHALQGWCPPIPILRRLGVRTAREIETERTALRILRGDFGASTSDPQRALQLARGEEEGAGSGAAGKAPALANALPA